jgi:hypothetical protein
VRRVLLPAAAGALEAPLGNAVVGHTAAAAAAAAAGSSPQLQMPLDAAAAAGGAAGLSPTSSLNLCSADGGVTDTVTDAQINNTAAAALTSLDSEQQAAGCTSPSSGAVVSSSVFLLPPLQQQLGRQRILAPPMPAVTMVFLVVEGAKVFGKGRRPLVKEVHAHLSQLLVEALRHVRAGYLCRMQVRLLLLL